MMVSPVYYVVNEGLTILYKLVFWIIDLFVIVALFDRNLFTLLV